MGDKIFTAREVLAAPEPLATPDQVADYLQIPAKTLAEWRSRGIGPDYVKPGGRHVRYRWPDVHSWVDTQQPVTA